MGFNTLSPVFTFQSRVVGLAVERVLAGFEVETKLSMGTEYMFMLFTENRLIMTRVAKVGKERMSLSNILGGMARGVGKVPKKPQTLEKLAGLSPDGILALDKNNFAVGYEHVVTVKVVSVGRNDAEITLITSDMKVTMSASLTAVVGVRDTMQGLLGSKFDFRL